MDTMKPHTFTDKNGKVLILKRLPIDRKAYGGFQYPTGVGSQVEAPDWNETSKCGGGLHGWPFSFGLGEGSDYELGDVWLVLAADPSEVVGELDGGWKCKCKKATIVYDGDFKGAMDMLRPLFSDCVKAMCSSGNSSNNASSGYSARNASSGDFASNASSGDGAENASAGDYAKNEATGRSSMCAAAGLDSRCKVGESGAFAIAFTRADGLPDFKVGVVGENGIKANTWYEVNNGELTEVK